jgi:tRNA dimethylallyltransferase
MDFLAITGPTTSGKTALSLLVAEAIGAEMVCMDSRQVYRGMDIGTDKADAELRQRVPHHGLDTRSPDETYSAGQFARDARGWIDEISSRGRVSLVVGGTGFFLKALTDPMFQEPEMEQARLGALRDHLADMPREQLKRWVRQLDPDRAALAIEGGPNRLMRTLEVALLTGRPLSWWHAQVPAGEAPLRGVIVILEVPREELDRRIDARVTRMADQGLVAEVERLLEAGYGPEDPGMTGTGYREVAAYLAGQTSLEDALDRTRSLTRKYARRQLTWFRHQMPDDVIRIEALQPVSDQADQVVEAWRLASRVTGMRGTNA